MLALHLRTKKKLEFWQVEKESVLPTWAADFLSDGRFKWNGEKSLSINNAGGLIKLTVPAGDYLVFNGKYLKAMPKRKFDNEYKVLSD